MTDAFDPSSRNPLARSPEERARLRRRVAWLRSSHGAVTAFVVTVLGLALVLQESIGLALGCAVVAAGAVGGAELLWRRRRPVEIPDPTLVGTDVDDEPIEWDAWTVVFTVLVVAPTMLLLLVVHHWLPAVVIGVLAWASAGSVGDAMVAFGGTVAAGTAWELTVVRILARRWGIDLDLV